LKLLSVEDVDSKAAERHFLVASEGAKKALAVVDSNSLVGALSIGLQSI